MDSNVAVALNSDVRGNRPGIGRRTGIAGNNGIGIVRAGGGRIVYFNIAYIAYLGPADILGGAGIPGLRLSNSTYGFSG